MTQALYLIATIYPAEKYTDFLIKEFKELVQKSYQEPGCEMYDLVVAENSKIWKMMEKWRSRVDWDNHMKSKHVAAINSLDKKYFDQPTHLEFLNPVI